MHAAIAVPLVSWDCFGASVFNSALLSHHHIPRQAPTDPQCLSPTVVCTRACFGCEVPAKECREQVPYPFNRYASDKCLYDAEK